VSWGSPVTQSYGSKQYKNWHICTLITACSQFHQNFTSSFAPVLFHQKKLQSQTVIREKLHETLLYNKLMVVKLFPKLCGENLSPNVCQRIVECQIIFTRKRHTPTCWKYCLQVYLLTNIDKWICITLKTRQAKEVKYMKLSFKLLNIRKMYHWIQLTFLNHKEIRSEEVLKNYWKSYFWLIGFFGDGVCHKTVVWNFILDEIKRPNLSQKS